MINQALRRLLQKDADNHVFPFFWLHGEEEETLRTYMAAIHGAGCGAVCVESRPHPDYCGPKWWADMDVILDEARQRGMKVWILDDSHFPTGYANGAMSTRPDALCRQNVFMNQCSLQPAQGQLSLDLRAAGLLEQPPQELTGFAAFANQPPARHFEDDSILCVTGQSEEGDQRDLTQYLAGDVLVWNKPQGAWKIHVCVRSRNTGCHRDYINMTEEESCRVLIDAVYEAHWQHYAADFGGAIAGFFSDEPELGNNTLYVKGNRLGSCQDLPWGPTLENQMKKALGQSWAVQLPLLWENGSPTQTARVRTLYMNLLTLRVRKAFSCQIGEWCHAHGVQYIGHSIEDEGQHARTGSGLGHYFRGLQGQDMAGIDDIGGQVLPQGERGPYTNQYGAPRNGEFYHYALAKLAVSAAAIEPRKNGNALCEIFGNYGWREGVQLEKYLVDHFLVRGINQFVPHAFSAAPFPDPDCPPHFFAHGHNPQYRHFGALMHYINRAATLISSGKQIAPVGILYPAEAEWADLAPPMQVETPLRVLCDAQIDCHILPADVFAGAQHDSTQPGSSLIVNGQAYDALVVPGADTLCLAAANGLEQLVAEGFAVYFAERRPAFVAETGAPLPSGLNRCPVVPILQLPEVLRRQGIALPRLQPASNRVRVLHIAGNTAVYLLVNEDSLSYTGTLVLPSQGECYQYDAWENQCYPMTTQSGAQGCSMKLTIEPLHSVFIVFGVCPQPLGTPLQIGGKPVSLTPWMRSVCEGADYPAFSPAQAVQLPDNLAQQAPEFSGFVRYSSSFDAAEGDKLLLVITNAAEGVEVFCNGVSAGLQIAAPYRYNLSRLARRGKNILVVEVATTLERQCYPLLQGFQKKITPPPTAQSGITGTVHLYQQ